jgi:cardiolipin synthase A/B
MGKIIGSRGAGNPVDATRKEMIAKATRYIAGNRIGLLNSGTEYFPALIAAINSAQREVLMETYIFADDATGRAVTEAMIQAVKRGASVRLVIDGFGSKDHIGALESVLRDGGVDLAIFRPERNRLSFRKSRLRRMHRKLVAVDERIAFVGGINIIDDLNMPPTAPGEKPYGPRFDFAVRVEGALVSSILRSMRSMWQRLHTRKRDAFREVLTRASVGFRTTTHATQNEIIDEPSHLAAFVYRDNVFYRRDIEEEYSDAIQSAKHEIVIANAYFFPGRRFSHTLNAAKARGVRVRLLLQGRREYFLQHYASRALYASLLNVGIEIFEYHDSFLHAKVAVVDGEWATVGSSNIDPFSLLLAREANVFVRDEQFAAQLAGTLESAIAGANVVHGELWSKRRWLDKLLTGFAYQTARGLMRILGYGYR